ncbi:MAG: mercury(II) reductase [Nitrososphaerales archaeon]
MSGSSKYELVILGQGSAAFAAAIKANDLGIKTALVGKNATLGTVVGGTCVNVGCVPSKNLITVGTAFHESKDGPGASSFSSIRYGKTKIDFKEAIQEKDVLVKRFRKEKYRDVLKSLESVDYVPALAHFVSKNEVGAENRTIRGEKFVIATGARAKIPSVEGANGIGYLTNEGALSLKELPSSIIVVGGRALGLEFAQMYAHFGTKVNVLQRSGNILPEDEPEISDALRQYLEQEGITVYTGTSLLHVTQNGRMKVVRANVKGKIHEFRAQQLLFATGRTPNTDYLQLERAGVELDQNGFVKANEEMQTSSPHIWAAGDVIGEPMLEAVAAKEGAVAVNNAFAKESEGKKKIDFREVPSAVFTYPEVARVGITEVEAERQGIKCNCRVLPLEAVPKAQIIGDARGLVKMVVDWNTKKIIGVHILAPHAADLIHEGVLAVKFRLTIDDIIDTVHIFPTLSEGIKLAAQSFYKDVSKMSCCTE